MQVSTLVFAGAICDDQEALDLACQLLQLPFFTLRKPAPNKLTAPVLLYLIACHLKKGVK